MFLLGLNEFIQTIMFTCSGHDKVVKTLIHNRAKINTINRNGFSALDFASNATRGKFKG